jgi:hypothetical protein
MIDPMKTLFTSLLLGGTFALAQLPLAGAIPATASAAREVVFPETSLRGYGSVSGKQRVLPGGASLLTIQCESPAKAELLQAKYLSDIALLPKTQVAQAALGGAGKKVPARLVENQGYLVAARKGSEVRILAAGELAAVEAVLAEKDWASWTFATEATVPMFLDRWDRRGFRAYYRSWMTPPKDYPPAKAEGGYDILKEFEFAEEMGRTGILTQTQSNPMDTAAGLHNDVWWDWIVPQTQARGLPLGLNIKVAEGSEATWLPNRFRDQMMQPMPQFGGTYFKTGSPFHGLRGTASWNAKEANQIQFDMVETLLRRFKDQPNLVTVLEPHGELKNLAHSIFMEYGPVADIGFQTYLKENYADIGALNVAWGTGYAAWSDVRVPEIASFAGWGEDAVDLTGEWKLAYEDLAPPLAGTDQRLLFFTDANWTKTIPSKPAPKEWFAGTFDDSAWVSVQAPGNDQSLITPSRPAVLRRQFSVSPDWLKKHKEVWLYVWDMNLASNDAFKAVLNDKVVDESKTQNMTPHWTAVEVSQILQAENNVLALRLPKGKLTYRVYLSGEAPHGYPYFEKGRNAQWYDFSMWHRWMRKESVRHGLETIRKVLPDQQVVQMAPDAYVDDIKELTREYGSNFHNTGYMSSFWADYLPSLMRGANLPTSAEPGGPASDLKSFKRQQGLWITEDIHAIDYFIHIGALMWNTEIREHFKKELSLFRTVGKYHAPQAEVAALYSTENTRLNGFPWILDPNKGLPSGYWNWNVRSVLRDYYPSDGLSESSFANGDAAAYRIIIDSNTSVMSEQMVSNIERYVRAGGTFVTFVQTGRHSTNEPDAWPIARLTGYAVEKIDALDSEGRILQSGKLTQAPGQTVLPGAWDGVNANGLHLRKVAADAEDVLLWGDGRVAMGVRPLGKGYIVQVGCKFTGDSIPDRLEPLQRDQASLHALPANGIESLTNLMTQLLEWRHIAPLPFSWKADNSGVIVRHYVSNNGLYDIWALWNQNVSRSVKGQLTLSGSPAAWCIDLLDNAALGMTDGAMSLDLQPLQTRMVMTPRNQIQSAPADWFKLQRNWWRGTKHGDLTPAKPVQVDNVLDLTEDWAVHVLAEGEQASAFIAPAVDDAAWPRKRLSVWPTAEWAEPKTIVLRRSFTIPKNWAGDVTITMESGSGSYFAGEGEIYLDGTSIQAKSKEGMDGFVSPSLKPGSTHELAVVISTRETLGGVRGNAWLWLWPKPAARVNLAGDWQESADNLRWGKSVRLPGKSAASALRRTVTVPATFDGMDNPQAYLDVDASGKIIGALVNGRFVRRYHRITTDRFQLNITPWIRFGEENEIELIRHWDESRGGDIRSVGLSIYMKPY